MPDTMDSIRPGLVETGYGAPSEAHGLISTRLAQASSAGGVKWKLAASKTVAMLLTRDQPVRTCDDGHRPRSASKHAPPDDGKCASPPRSPLIYSPLTNAYKVRTGTPVAPFTMMPTSFELSVVPAMSTCSHGVSPANSDKNRAAVMAPP